MAFFVTFAVKVITFSRPKNQEKAFSVHESTPMMEKVMHNSPVVKTIVNATDLGENTRPVFRHALSMANHYDAGIIIVMGKSTRKVRGIRVMGSTAGRGSRMSNLPVLVVPNY